MGRVLEDLQILLRAQPVIAAVAEPIVGEAEPGRRKQILAIDVVGERARLPHQLIDDVPVVDGVLVATDQPRPRLHVAVGVPDFDAIGEQPGFDPFADQPAVDRIGVAMDVDQATGVDATADLQATVDSLIGQFAEPGQFLGEAVPTAGVAGLHHVPQEGHVLGPAGEVAAAAQEQGLVDGGLEVPVRRLGVAVLMRLADVDPLTRHAVVGEQVPIPRLKLPRRRQVVHGRSQAVAAVPPRHAAQVPERRLQPVGERLERFRRTNAYRFPVRVGQHEVVHQVIERLPGNRNAQIVHAGEVRRREVPGLMHLAEHDRAVGPGQRPPLPHPPLKGPPVRIEELPRMFSPQPVEQRLRQQPRLGPQPFFHRRPHRGERIDPRPVRTRHRARAWQRRVIAIMTRRLVGHTRPPGRHGQWSSRIQLAQQPAYLAIRNHRIPPSLRELRSWPDSHKPGILIVARWGKPIDAQHIWVSFITLGSCKISPATTWNCDSKLPGGL
jgi:hypothetical protein